MSSSEWDQRYDRVDYLFGETPNAFLKSQVARFSKGQTALVIADGEGRNGVWLAEHGLDVLSVDASVVALRKAQALADRRGVKPRFEQVDLDSWTMPKSQFDHVVAIFIQFAGPEFRARLFKAMSEALKPGGVLILEGYRPEQLGYGTGGPRAIENLYTESLLRDAFKDMEIIHLHAYDASIKEGDGHNGMSALIDFVARKPVDYNI